MDTWPLTLQQKLNSSGFQVSMGETRVSTDMGVGPAKVRNRFTQAIDKYSCEMFLNFDEYSTFTSFYKTTLAGGTKPFLFKDPFSEVDETFRFDPSQTPSITPLGGKVFILRMVWEKLS